jgi:hypothetical protein
VSHRGVKGKGDVLRLMLHESEEALNVMTAPERMSDDAMQPLFARDSWFAALRRHCFADAQVVELEGESGSVRCRLPLLEATPEQLRSLSNWYSFRWAPTVTGDGDAIERAAAQRAAFAVARARAWSLTLTPVTTEGGVSADLIGALRESGWLVRASVISKNCWVDTNGRDFATWWAARPGQLRSTVARKAKKAAVILAIHRTFSDALWDAYEQVYAHSWKPEEGSPAFLRELAQAASQSGALRLGIATMDGAPVAAQFWTVEAGVASIHKLAQVRGEAVEHASPGTLLTHHMYEHGFDVDQVRRIDFGTGSDRFKSDWTESCADLMQIIAVDLRRPRSWLFLAQCGLSRVAAKLSRR